MDNNTLSFTLKSFGTTVEVNISDIDMDSEYNSDLTGSLFNIVYSMTDSINQKLKQYRQYKIDKVSNECIESEVDKDEICEKEEYAIELKNLDKYDTVTISDVKRAMIDTTNDNQVSNIPQDNIIINFQDSLRKSIPILINKYEQILACNTNLSSEANLSDLNDLRNTICKLKDFNNFLKDWNDSPIYHSNEYNWNMMSNWNTIGG